MSYVSKISKGIDFIELNLFEDFELVAVAEAAGLSLWHFQRIFSALTGETLKSYIRARRLSLAMKSLLRTEDRIIEIALQSGYESQESFTRAFHQSFGVTPGDFRKNKKSHAFMEKIKIDRDYLNHIASDLAKTPEILGAPSKMYVGLRTVFFGAESEKNNMAEKLPALWGEFLPRMSEVSCTVPGAAYGLLRQVDDRTGELEYLSALEVSEMPARLPDGMVPIVIPERKYAQFLHRGEVRNLNHSVNYIYSSWLLNSDYSHASDFDIEKYGAKYHPTSKESEIYYLIPVVAGSGEV